MALAARFGVSSRPSRSGFSPRPLMISRYCWDKGSVMAVPWDSRSLEVAAAVQGKGRSGYVGIVQHIAQALIKGLRTGLHAQRRLGQSPGPIGLVITLVEHQQRRGDGVDLDAWRKA